MSENSPGLPWGLNSSCNFWCTVVLLSLYIVIRYILTRKIRGFLQPYLKRGLGENVCLPRVQARSFRIENCGLDARKILLEVSGKSILGNRAERLPDQG